jgi:hypothetical protein
MPRPASKKQLAMFWLENYEVKIEGIGGYCGLCGNTGLIDTRNSAKTPRGQQCGGVFPCVCPNGRAIKPDFDKTD